MRPRQIYARKTDEEQPSWWQTLNGLDYLRWRPHMILDTANKGELIVCAHGLADQMLMREFSRHQHERFQPVRQGCT